MSPNVSVVIPAFNEAKNIAKTLQALADQKCQTQFEVILVNNNSTDRTAVIAQTFTSKLNLRVIDELRPGRGAARAAGFRSACGTLILSTDADTVVPSDWVDSLVLALSGSTTAVSGTCRIADCSASTQAIFNWFQPIAMRIYRLVFGHFWLTGSNFGIHKDIYEAAGGFDPGLPDLEDIEFSQRLSRFTTIKFINNLPVVTCGQRFNKGLARGLWAYIRAYIARFWFKNPENLRDLTQKK